MIGKREFTAGNYGDQGFTLVELLVVIAIIGILALQVFTLSRNPLVDVKSAIFGLRSDLGLARTEAVRRNAQLLVAFVWGAGLSDPDGYDICMDDVVVDNTCADEVGTASEIKSVRWDPRVQYYERTVPSPGGPDNSVSGIVDIWPDPDAVDQDGVNFPLDDSDQDYVVMLPDGSCASAGEVYLFAPDPTDTAVKLRTPPLALAVGQSGTMQIWRWSGAWNTK
jgi:prepilin-type N-terminal cleavage/methylation domain-containing protein